ncbi:MAG: hypothetical protein ACOYMA_18510 [Bacteroidia bacterium]
MLEKKIYTENFFSVYLKLSISGIIGFLFAKTILFFQWYWIIAPEYRNINGDMDEGMDWIVLDSIFGTFGIGISFLISVAIIKGIDKSKT